MISNRLNSIPIQTSQPKIARSVAPKVEQKPNPEPPVSDRVRLQTLQPLDTPKDSISTLVDDLGYVEFPQVSPDGKTLVFNVVGDYATSQMMRVSSAGGEVKALESGQTIDADNVGQYLVDHQGSIREQATWTGDGQHLLYRTNENGTFDIGQYNLADGSQSLVAVDPNLNLKHPVQMGDGKIVFYGGPPGEQYPTTDRYSNLFLVDPISGQKTQLTHSKGEVAYKHPAPIPGGIVAHLEDKSREGVSDVIFLNPESGEQSKLTNTPLADERHPFYNEKVELMVYHRKEAGDKNLVLSTPDGSRSAQLTFYGRPAQSPCWSPDGKKIYFVKKEAKQPEGEPFYVRKADVRVIDVESALKDLEKQAKKRLKKLKKSDADPELQKLAQQQLDNYEYFLRRY